MSREKNRVRVSVVFGIAVVALSLGCPSFVKAQEVAMNFPLAEQLRVKKGSPVDFTFDLPEDKAVNSQVRLLMDARIEWEREIGNAYAMKITINGRELAGKHLMNKQLFYTFRNGTESNWASGLNGTTYRLMFAPDFSDRIKTDPDVFYGLPDPKQDPFHFMWDISSYVNPGKNTMTIQTSRELALRDVRIEGGRDPISYFQKGKEKVDTAVSPAPTGTLDVYTPERGAASFSAVYASPSGNLRIVGPGNEKLTLRSRTSLPDGKWAEDDRPAEEQVRKGQPFESQWTGDNYRVQRTITLHEDHIAVSDTISNTGAELVGVIVENRLTLPEPPEKVCLGGKELPKWITDTANAYNPTVIAELDNAAVGLVAEDDIFRVHCRLLQRDDGIGLADRSLGIAPGDSHTLEWSIYVVEGGDYWSVINTVRRNWDVNFTMEGPMNLYSPKYFPSHLNFNADSVRKWLQEKNNKLAWVMTHITANFSVVHPGTPERPRALFGTAILDPGGKNWLEHARKLKTLLKEVAPEMKFFTFMHPNYCTEIGHREKYRDSVAIDRDGNPIEIPYAVKPSALIPMVDNSYGEALKKVYEYYVDDIGANMYIDHSTVGLIGSNPSGRAPYEKWDGCTVKIDTESHAVTRKESVDILLMQPWYKELNDYVRSKGKSIMANHTPRTRTMQDWKWQHFSEDYGPKSIIETHLSTPLAFSYKMGVSGYKHMTEYLDYGGIQFTRGGDWCDYMYPITVIGLHPGMVFAEERILTNRSGRFGWGDDSEADVYMFDGNGEPVNDPDVKQVREGDQVFTDIRMPSDHVAILVRKQ